MYPLLEATSVKAWPAYTFVIRNSKNWHLMALVIIEPCHPHQPVPDTIPSAI